MIYDQASFNFMCHSHESGNPFVEEMKVTTPVFLDASQNMVAKSYAMILLDSINDGAMTTLPNML
jgi:hypothetical protein